MPAPPGSCARVRSEERREGKARHPSLAKPGKKGELVWGTPACGARKGSLSFILRSLEGRSFTGALGWSFLVAPLRWSFSSALRLRLFFSLSLRCAARRPAAQRRDPFVFLTQA